MSEQLLLGVEIGRQQDSVENVVEVAFLGVIHQCIFRRAILNIIIVIQDHRRLLLRNIVQLRECSTTLAREVKRTVLTQILSLEGRFRQRRKRPVKVIRLIWVGLAVQG